MNYANNIEVFANYRAPCAMVGVDQNNKLRTLPNGKGTRFEKPW